MPTDIVVPNGDEEEFEKMAKKLGYDRLIFLYTKHSGKAEKEKSAYLADKQNEVQKFKGKYKYIFSEEQWGMEDKRVDLVFNIAGDKDFVHHRGSGTDHVLMKDAKNKLAFAFSQMYREDNDKIMGRMMQNVKLCRKYEVPMVIASFAADPYEMRAPKDLEAWGRTLGMHPKEAKEAIRRF